MRRLIAALASVLLIAAACTPFTSAASDADGGSADASGVQADSSDSSDGSVSVNDTGVPTSLQPCGSISDEFERANADVVRAPWNALVVDPGGSSAGIVPPTGDGTMNRVFQSSAHGGSRAYLRADLGAQVPKAMTCSFTFTPTTNFNSGDPNTPGAGSGIDIFVIALAHGDGTRTLLRFSYKTGTIELRQDEADEDDICSGKSCAINDIAMPATGMGMGLASSMTLKTDFASAQFHADTNLKGAHVEQAFPGIAPITSVQLYLGVIVFGSDTQLGSYDHFHCDLSC